MLPYSGFGPLHGLGICSPNERLEVAYTAAIYLFIGLLDMLRWHVILPEADIVRSALLLSCIVPLITAFHFCCCSSRICPGVVQAVIFAVILGVLLSIYGFPEWLYSLACVYTAILFWQASVRMSLIVIVSFTDILNLRNDKAS